MKKVGLFGGAFDPMHRGHLDMALAAKNQLQLDEIWILIDKNPRRKKTVSKYTHRLQIASLMCKNHDFIVVDRLDMQTKGVTHSLKTQKELYEKFPMYEFTIILGIDAASHFDKWEAPKTFCELVNFAIVRRPGYSDNIDEMLGRLGKLREKYYYQYIDIEPSEISSSYIRDTLRSGGQVDGLNKEVIEYIYQNRLYE